MHYIALRDSVKSESPNKWKNKTISVIQAKWLMACNRMSDVREPSGFRGQWQIWHTRGRLYLRGRWGSILRRESLDWDSLMYPRRSPRHTWPCRCRRRRSGRARASRHPCRCNSDRPMYSYRMRLWGQHSWISTAWSHSSLRGFQGSDGAKTTKD